MRELLPIIEMAGIRLVVTEPKVTPIPTTAGINLKIGFSTAAVVSFVSSVKFGY